MRILVAEDECVTQRILQALLRNWGDEVVTVADGLAAWELARPRRRKPRSPSSIG